MLQAMSGKGTRNSSKGSNGSAVLQHTKSISKRMPSSSESDAASQIEPSGETVDAAALDTSVPIYITQEVFSSTIFLIWKRRLML